MVHKHLQQNPEILEEAKKQVYAKRLVQPEEIASLVFY
jgi:hypothetical protein